MLLTFESPTEREVIRQAFHAGATGDPEYFRAIWYRLIQVTSAADFASTAMSQWHKRYILDGIGPHHGRRQTSAGSSFVEASSLAATLQSVNNLSRHFMALHALRGRYSRDIEQVSIANSQRNATWTPLLPSQVWYCDAGEDRRMIFMHQGLVLE